MVRIFVLQLLVIILGHVTSNKLNYVVLIADDLGIGDVGCFGNKTLPTPNIDSIAQNGARLSHHKAAAAVCTPSRAAFLTGRYPIRAGMESTGRNKVFLFVAQSGGLPQTEVTFAKMLQNNGYSTALIGKWHLGNNAKVIGDLEHHPLRHGFDYFYGLPLTNLKDFGDDGQSVVTTYMTHFYPVILMSITLGLIIVLFNKTDKTFNFLIYLILCILPALTGIFVANIKTWNGIVMLNDEIVEQPIKLQGMTQKFVQRAHNFLKLQSQKDQPFLLMINFLHVHTALFCEEEFKGKSEHGPYGDNVLELDWAVGQILQYLKEFGFMNNTLTYFSSDNGAHIEEESPSGQREGGSNGIYGGGKMMGGMEGGIRVPTAIMLPNIIPPNTEVSALTSQMDIFPTILSLSSIPIPPELKIDGKDMTSLLLGQDTKSKHTTLFHYCGINIHAATHITPDNQAMKIHYATPKWLPGTRRCDYVCHCFGGFIVNHNPPLLYNLNHDPSELKALSIKSHIEYTKLILTVEQAKKEHQQSIQPIISQFSFINSVWLPWLQPCCNFPLCQCSKL